MDIRRKSAQDRIRGAHPAARRADRGRAESATRWSSASWTELEGRAEAFDLGRGGKSLEEEFVELEGEGKVEEELAALKQRMAGAAPSGSTPRAVVLCFLLERFPRGGVARA